MNLQEAINLILSSTIGDMHRAARLIVDELTRTRLKSRHRREAIKSQESMIKIWKAIAMKNSAERLLIMERMEREKN